MIVYLRIDLLENCEKITAYHRVENSPSYVWRYTNYQEGTNYFRTHVYRTQFNNSILGMGLTVF